MRYRGYRGHNAPIATSTIKRKRLICAPELRSVRSNMRTCEIESVANEWNYPIYTLYPACGILAGEILALHYTISTQL